jgi:hypothetical protein
MQPQRRPGQRPAQVVPGQVGGLAERLAGAGGVARTAQRLPQADQQPGPALGTELSRGRGQPQRPPVVPGRVLVGQDGRRLLGGQLAVADGSGRLRLRDLPALVDRPQVMAGELGRAHLRPRPARRLQGRGRLQVEPGPGRRVELAVEDLAVQVVGEPPGAELVGRGNQHPGPGGLAELGQHLAHRLAGDPGQDGRAQVGPEHRGRLEQPHARVAEGGEPSLDGVADPVLAAHPYGGRVRVGGQQPRHLLDEERVAAGPPVHARPQLGVGLAAGEPGEHLGDLRGVEAAQRQRLALRLQPGDRAAERVAGSDLDVAVGRDQQLAAAAGPAGVEGGQLDRRRVGPVQVVEDDHQRRPPGGLQQGAAGGVEALEPAGQRGRLAGRAGVLEAGLDPERGQDLQPGPERRGALPAGAPDDGRAPRLGVVGGGRGQGGLADPGLAGEGHDPAPGRQRGLDQRSQLGERLVAADKRGGGRGHRTRTVRSPTPSRKGVSRRSRPAAPGSARPSRRPRSAGSSRCPSAWRWRPAW